MFLYDKIRSFFTYVVKFDEVDLSITGIVFLLSLAVLLLLIRKGIVKSIYTGVSIMLLPAYIFALFIAAVFTRESTVSETMMLDPVWKYLELFQGETKYITEIIVNIIMFIPLGLLLPGFKRIRIGYLLLISVLISITIELLQLITKTGIFEINDLINNIIGFCVGLVVYYLFIKMIVHDDG